MKDNVVPCSDGAGQVVAVGSSVENFKPGDRVSANFSLDHVYGDIESLEQRSYGLGGLVDGVLTEYRAFPVHVRTFLIGFNLILRANDRIVLIRKLL